METYQIVIGIIFLAMAGGALVISWFQFMEKGYLFNNAYIWASKEERGRMDKNKESKTPYYRQSGVVFLLIGIFCLIFAVYVITQWMWMYAAFWLVVMIAVAYAIVSSVKLERQQRQKT